MKFAQISKAFRVKGCQIQFRLEKIPYDSENLIFISVLDEAQLSKSTENQFGNQNDTHFDFEHF